MLSLTRQLLQLRQERREAAKKMGLIDLPPEVLILIGCYLDIKSLMALSVVNSTFKNLLYEDQLLWKDLYRTHWRSTKKWRYALHSAAPPPGLFVVI